MPAVPDIGTGATFAIGNIFISNTTAWSNIISISGTAGTRGSADPSHLGQLSTTEMGTNATDTHAVHRLLPHLTYTPGELQIEVLLDGSMTSDWTYDYLLQSDSSNADVQWFHLKIPEEPGTTNVATFTGNGFVTGLDINAPFEDMVTGTWTFQLSTAISVN